MWNVSVELACSATSVSPWSTKWAADNGRCDVRREDLLSWEDVDSSLGGCGIRTSGEQSATLKKNPREDLAFPQVLQVIRALDSKLGLFSWSLIGSLPNPRAFQNAVRTVSVCMSYSWSSLLLEILVCLCGHLFFADDLKIILLDIIACLSSI